MKTTLRALAALAFAVSVAACSDSPSGSGGGGGQARQLSIGTAATGQLAAGKADEFQVTSALVVSRLVLQARSGSAADTLVAELLDRGSVIATVTSVGTDTVLAAQAAGWVAPQSGGSWRVRVRGAGANDAGPYTVQLFPENLAPEQVPNTLTFGQAVAGERLDVGGDVDQYQLNAQTGVEMILFLGSATHPSGRIRAQLLDAANAVVATVTTEGRTAAVEERSSGRFVIPHDGVYHVRVDGMDAAELGAYQLRLDIVARGPETGAAAQAVGAVFGDEIGTVGDIDQFTFTGAAGQEINLLAQLESGMQAGLTVELVGFGGPVASFTTSTVAASLDEVGTGLVVLPQAGQYTVRVYGPAAGNPSVATGRYRLELYPVDRRVEGTAAVAVNAPPVTSALDRPGDVDEFAFTATQGAWVVLRLIAHAPLGGRMLAEMLGPDRTIYSRVSNTTLGIADSLGALVEYGGHVLIPATGTYTVRVRSADPPLMSRGAYQLELYTISTVPETAPAALTVGQTVTSEAIDRPSDIDVFTLAGEPGREVNIFLSAPASTGDVEASLRLPGQSTPTLFTLAGNTLDEASLGRLTMTAGTYRITVEQGGVVSRRLTGSQGGYSLRVFPIDRRPEGRGGAYTLGETVQGEPVYPVGDIDEYTFTLTQTTPIHIGWDSDPALAGRIRKQGATGWVWHSKSVVTEGVPLRDITLDAGTYTLEVSQEFIEIYEKRTLWAEPSTRAYTFTLTPQTAAARLRRR